MWAWEKTFVKDLFLKSASWMESHKSPSTHLLVMFLLWPAIVVWGLEKKPFGEKADLLKIAGMILSSCHSTCLIKIVSDSKRSKVILIYYSNTRFELKVHIAHSGEASLKNKDIRCLSPLLDESHKDDGIFEVGLSKFHIRPIIRSQVDTLI